MPKDCYELCWEAKNGQHQIVRGYKTKREALVAMRKLGKDSELHRIVNGMTSSIVCYDAKGRLSTSFDDMG